MTSAPSILAKLMRMLANTQERELDCGEVFAVLDAYAQAVAVGEDVSQLYPLVVHHLQLCPDCLEEYTALLNVIQTLH